MKLVLDSCLFVHDHVTPFVGVWIEIFQRFYRLIVILVTPFVGVWIEIEEELRHTLEAAQGHSLRGSVD